MRAVIVLRVDTLRRKPFSLLIRSFCWFDNEGKMFFCDNKFDFRLIKFLDRAKLAKVSSLVCILFKSIIWDSLFESWLLLLFNSDDDFCFCLVNDEADDVSLFSDMKLRFVCTRSSSRLSCESKNWLIFSLLSMLVLRAKSLSSSS